MRTPDSLTKRNQHCNTQCHDPNEYGRLDAKAFNIADLLNPWNDAIEEAKGHDVLGPCTSSVSTVTMSGQSHLPLTSISASELTGRRQSDTYAMVIVGTAVSANDTMP